MEKKARIGVVRVSVNLIKPLCVESARAPYQSVDLIILAQQELSKIRTILAGDSSDKSFFHSKRLLMAFT
jgi:hypothetical protein